jgi:hypothetical protein
MSKREIWKDIPGYVGLYQASNLGRIRRNSRELKDNIGRRYRAIFRLMRCTTTRQGYLQLGLCRSGRQKSYLVHRLVLMAFYGDNPPEIQCNHIDGVKTNNHVNNLEWATRLENMTHAYQTGLVAKKGEMNHNAVLNWKKVGQIRKALKKGAKPKELSEIFGVVPGHIWAIGKNIRWVENGSPEQWGNNEKHP